MGTACDEPTTLAGRRAKSTRVRDKPFVYSRWPTSVDAEGLRAEGGALPGSAAPGSAPGAAGGGSAAPRVEGKVCFGQPASPHYLPRCGRVLHEGCHQRVIDFLIRRIVPGERTYPIGRE